MNDYYSDALSKGTSLKDKIDKMEKDLADRQKDKELEKDMALATEQLDTLVDHLILTSGKLVDLKESSKRIDDLMTSLLCYSLSRFREKKAKKIQERTRKK